MYGNILLRASLTMSPISGDNKPSPPLITKGRTDMQLVPGPCCSCTGACVPPGGAAPRGKPPELAPFVLATPPRPLLLIIFIMAREEAIPPPPPLPPDIIIIIMGSMPPLPPDIPLTMVLVTVMGDRHFSSVSLIALDCIIAIMAALPPPTPPAAVPTMEHKRWDSGEKHPSERPIVLVRGGRATMGSTHPCDS